jgi:RNA polymerase sporulation-specific sigma factor
MNYTYGGGFTLNTTPATKDYINFGELPDEQVAELARENDADAQEYLLTKYKNFVRAKARSYFLIGADREDIVQEGMIGLYKAIRDFRMSKLTSFRAFAELCVTRQIITAIKTATRQKHRPLNSYVSLNKPVYDEESDRMLIDVLSSSKISNPEDIFIGKEDFSTIESKMGKLLSPLELKVLQKYIEGKSYLEVAKELNRSVKSIDNSLQRVKNKLEKLVSSETEI